MTNWNFYIMSNTISCCGSGTYIFAYNGDRGFISKVWKSTKYVYSLKVYKENESELMMLINSSDFRVFEITGKNDCIRKINVMISRGEKYRPNKHFAKLLDDNLAELSAIRDTFYR